MRGVKYSAFFVLFLLLLSGIVYSTSDIPSRTLGEEPSSLAINPDTGVGVAANEISNSVSVIDLYREVIETIPVGASPRGVAIDRELNLALVSNSKDDTVSVIDLGTFKEIAEIPVSAGPEGVAIDRAAYIALVADSKANSVSVIDLKALKVVATIPVGNNPKDVAIDPDLRIALTANYDGRNISVIDLSSLSFKNSMTAEGRPVAVDINPLTHTAVVANEGSTTLTVIDLTTWVTKAVETGYHPVDVVINELDNQAVAVCGEERSLIVIDIDAGAVVWAYELEEAPNGVAVDNFTNIAGVINRSTDSLMLVQLPNPVPRLDSIEPGTLTRGSSNATLALTGAMFINASSVSISSASGSYPLTPVFKDNNTLEVSVPDEMLQDIGTYEATVTNPAPEGGTSLALTLTVENPAPQITVLDPLEVTAGSSGLTLNVYGTGFFGDTNLYVDGEVRESKYDSYRKATLDLASSELEYGKYIKVSAQNPTPGGGSSGTSTFSVLNPVPELTSISPTEIGINTAFTLSIVGDRFVDTSEVSFSGTLLAATRKSSKSLEVEISDGVITEAGDYEVRS